VGGGCMAHVERDGQRSVNSSETTACKPLFIMLANGCMGLD